MKGGERKEEGGLGRSDQESKWLGGMGWQMGSGRGVEGESFYDEHKEDTPQ